MKKIILFLLASLQVAVCQSVVLKSLDPKILKTTNEHLKDYQLLQLDVNDLTKKMDAIKGNIKEITLRTPEKNWQLQLFEYDLVSKNMVRNTGDIKNLKRLPNRTDFRSFTGYIKGLNSLVSMCIADGFFSIMIDDRQNRYFIEPVDRESLSDLIPANQQFLFYKAQDVIPAKGKMCTATMVHNEVQHTIEKIQNESRIKPCRICAEVKIGLAAENFMYRKYGDVPKTENQMLTILADVQTVFDDEFQNEYVYEATGTYVADNPMTDPFNGINNINTLLSQFNSLADILFSGAEHNVATLWNAKFGVLGPYGAAYQATVCFIDRYNVCTDYWSQGGRQPDYLTLQAHMLGHNWSMIHDPFPGLIMSDGLPSGSTSWSFQAKDFLNAYARDYKLIELGYLTLCPNSSAPVPEWSADITYGCLPVTIKFKDLSLNTTKWKWKFPGGTPDTSTLQNPIITYKTVGRWDVILEAGNSYCDVVGTKSGYIEINDVPFPDFSYGNQGREVFFIDQSLRATEYLWKFGDGEESEEINPYHEYATDSTYEVTLRVTNDCGVTTIKKKITIVSVPTAEFTADTLGGCAPGIIKFIDQSTQNVKTWQWEFVGGVPSVSTLKNPVVRYDLPGTYDVRLTVYSTRFNHSITKKAFITIDSIPDAAFTNMVTVGKVDFTNQSRFAKSHLWIFGDNSTSSEANPTHNYTEGTYNVCYVAINGCGTDTAKTQLTIGVKPTAGFTVSNPKGCAPFKVQFQNTSTAANTYKWYFPGGNPATSTDPNPLVTYNAKGKFNVSLVAYNVFYSDSTGKADFVNVNSTPDANFSNTISGFKSFFTDLSTGGTNYFWDFGDGRPSFEKNPVHDYGVEGEFKVRFIVSNECGLDTFIKTIAVYLVPKVNFQVDTVRGCAPLTVQFKDASSVDVVDWEWIFENGIPSTSKEKNPVVVFNNKGKYTVKLTIKNTNGSNALTRPQFIQVLSPVLCPERSKGNHELLNSDIIEFPFDFGIESRSGTQVDKSIFVYPNPASDYIYVNAKLVPGKTISIEVYSLSGQKIGSHVSKDAFFRLDTKQFNPGTYYLRIFNGEYTQISKFNIAQ